MDDDFIPEEELAEDPNEETLLNGEAQIEEHRQILAAPQVPIGTRKKRGEIPSSGE